MFLLKEKIFSYFGNHAKLNDSNKDANNKGIWERYNEALGEDYDEQLAPLINNYIDNLVVPETALDKFIPYLENLFGGMVSIYEDISFRRKILKFASRINQVKGTKLSYEMLFLMAGFDTITITEDFTFNSFDSPLTFDDDGRRFDEGRCKPCSEYEIALTGSITMDDKLKEAVFNIIEYVEPINAILSRVTYNGDVIVKELITIFVDSNMNLIYDNTNDPTLTFELVNGQLIVGGPNKDKYKLDENINLIYTP